MRIELQNSISAGLRGTKKVSRKPFFAISRASKKDQPHFMQCVEI